MRATLRRLHFVGSQPADVEQTIYDAMSSTFRRFGSVLSSLPHGDINRQGWIVPIVHRTQAFPGFRIIRPGLFRNYADLPLAEFHGSQLEFPRHFLGYHAEAIDAFQARAAIEAEYARRGSDVTMPPVQIGVPFWLDHRDFSVQATPGQLEWLADAFIKALVDELVEIHQEWGDQVVVQLESPYSLLRVHLAQAGGEQVDVAQEMAQAFALLRSRLPSSLRVGLHLCRGDLNHESWGQGEIGSLEPLVLLANAVSQQWPELEYIHLPIVAGDAWQPPASSSFYRPLAQLDQRMVWLAGIVHEYATLEQNCTALKFASRALGRSFDGIGLSCGMGRMTHRQYAAALDSLEGVLSTMS